MKAAFVFDKQTSPLNRITAAQVIKYPEAEYMALCKFNNVYWEHDSKHNYSPKLIFEGEVERIDSINTKFPHNIDAVYFTENKPNVRYEYSFTEKQLATLAGKGFWSDEGVNIPDLFTTAKFQLETQAVIEEIAGSYEENGVPILTVELVNPYENKFNESAYELVSHITRKTKEASVEVAQTKQEYVVEHDIQSEIEAAKAALAEQQKNEQKAAYKPLSAEELEMRSKSAGVSDYVNTIRDNTEKIRDANNAKVEAEREKQRLADAQANESQSDEVKDPNTVTFGEIKKTENVEVKTAVEEQKYESNTDIFAAEESVDPTDIPDNISEFMKQLDAETGTSTDAKSDKKTDNNSSGSASGTETQGGYTFADEDSAQSKMRQDEGKGNEKPADEKKDDENEKKDEEKSDVSDNKTESEHIKNKKAALSVAANTDVVTATPEVDDRSKG